MNGTPDTPPGTTPSPGPQDWLVTDLQDETRQLLDRLAAVSQQISEQVTQLGAWADSLPNRQVRDHDPVRVADLALNDLPGPTGTSVNDDRPPAEPGSGTSPGGPAQPAGKVEVVAYCHTAWNDSDVFERQRQAIRTALEFDGVRAWHGTLPADIGQELPRWQAILTAAQAGASVQIRLSPQGRQ